MPFLKVFERGKFIQNLAPSYANAYVVLSASVNVNVRVRASDEKKCEWRR